MPKSRFCREYCRSAWSNRRLAPRVLLRLLHRQADVVEAGVHAGIEHEHRRAVPGVGVADHQHAPPLVVLRRVRSASALRMSISPKTCFVVDPDLVARLDADGEELRIGLQIGGRFTLPAAPDWA